MSGLKLLDLDSWAEICCWAWTTGLAFLSLGAGLAFLGLNSWPWIPVFGIPAILIPVIGDLNLLPEFRFRTAIDKIRALLGIGMCCLVMLDFASLWIAPLCLLLHCFAS